MGFKVGGVFRAHEAGQLHRQIGFADVSAAAGLGVTAWHASARRSLPFPSPDAAPTSPAAARGSSGEALTAAASAGRTGSGEKIAVWRESISTVPTLANTELSTQIKSIVRPTLGRAPAGGGRGRPAGHRGAVGIVVMVGDGEDADLGRMRGAHFCSASRASSARAKTNSKKFTTLCPAHFAPSDRWWWRRARGYADSARLAWVGAHLGSGNDDSDSPP